MPIDCSKITQDLVAAECGESAIAGTRSRVILLNYSDVDRPGSTVTDNVISQIKLISDTVFGHTFDTYDGSSTGSTSFNQGVYRNTITHQLIIRVFIKTEQAKKFVNGAIDSRIVPIVDNKEDGRDGSTRYEVYGWDSGLKLTDLTFSTEMPDGIVYELTFSSDDISQERTVPKSFWAGTVAATETALNALLPADPEP